MFTIGGVLALVAVGIWMTRRLKAVAVLWDVIEDMATYVEKISSEPCDDDTLRILKEVQDRLDREQRNPFDSNGSKPPKNGTEE